MHVNIPISHVFLASSNTSITTPIVHGFSTSNTWCNPLRSRLVGCNRQSRLQAMANLSVWLDGGSAPFNTPPTADRFRPPASITFDGPAPTCFEALPVSRGRLLHGGHG